VRASPRAFPWFFLGFYPGLFQQAFGMDFALAAVFPQVR
jgi:hypothetical protein